MDFKSEEENNVSKVYTKQITCKHAQIECFTLYECLPGSSLLLHANGFLWVSHLKGYTVHNYENEDYPT